MGKPFNGIVVLDSVADENITAKEVFDILASGTLVFVVLNGAGTTGYIEQYFIKSAALSSEKYYFIYAGNDGVTVGEDVTAKTAVEQIESDGLDADDEFFDIF